MAAAVSGYFRTLTAYTPVFTSWNGKLYESELVRAAIDARARHISKLKVDIRGSARPALQTKLRHAPNEWQTWGQFLYRLSTILDMQNTAFIVPVLDGFLQTVGYYTVLPSQCEIIQIDGDPWLRYSFSNGLRAAVEMHRCAIMTKFQYQDDFFGESNRALDSTMSLIDIQKQGIEEAVRSSATYRFMARVTNFTKTDDLAKERERFTKENFAKDGGGILLFPNTYQDIKQIQTAPYTVNPEEMAQIRQNVFTYFGVNDDILQNKAYGDSWAAFYEGGIEPFAIQFSDVMTAATFTERERSAGALIMATANRLQYLSTTEKLNVSSQMADRGIMNRDEIRDIWNLPPLPDGQGQAYTIRGEYYLLNADGSATRHSDDLTGGNDNGD